MKVYKATAVEIEIETIGYFSTNEKAWQEALRVDPATGSVTPIEIDRTRDWATPQALAEDRAAQKRGAK